MTKFKIGDRVNIPDDCIVNYERGATVGTVIEIMSSGVRVREDGRGDDGGCYGHDYTLIKEGGSMKRKFRIGDRVKVIKSESSPGRKHMGTQEYVGMTGAITVNDGSGAHSIKIEGVESWWAEWELQLIGKGAKKVMGKRTFKQLKDNQAIRKGAIWQEECEDGTQPYALITPELCKFESDDREYSQPCREIIEQNPTWFVEVFPASEAFLTKEELATFRQFVKAQQHFKKVTTPKVEVQRVKRKYTKKTK